MITLIKKLLLLVFRQFENHGILFTMRRKIMSPMVLKEFAECRKRSMCPLTHFDTVYRALELVNQNMTQGDIVLCGVARGGLAKFILKYMGRDRKLWLYDTYDGGSLPSERDTAFDRSVGQHVKQHMATNEDEVRAYLNDPRCVFVTGDVMKTLPELAPNKIAVLYLDTDWHDTTLHELNCLVPYVSRGGVIFQDDCGMCAGAMQAIRKFYRHQMPLLVPMSESGVVWTV